MCSHPFRTAIQFCVGIFVAAAVLHTWLAMGLFVPVTVAGSSMTPTLNGPHEDFRCDACGETFPVGLDEIEFGLAPACPSCGSRLATTTGDGVAVGERIVVDRTAFMFRPPRRWEVIVFRSPHDAGQLCVKRVVGLPGETVSFADGDAWIDGRKMDCPYKLNFYVRLGDRPQPGDRWDLGPNEFFVLGDNEAISDDSRNWEGGGGLDANLVVGKPLGVR